MVRFWQIWSYYRYKGIIGGWKLKRYNKYLVLSLVLVVITSCSIIDKTPTLVVDDYNGIDLNMIHKYEIEVDFDPSTKSYSAYQKLTYVNNTGTVLEEVYFHLYPNAYKRLETAPILFNEDVLSKGYVPGYIEIEEIKVEGKEVDFFIQGHGETILKVALLKPLAADEKVEIELKYEGKLPLNIDRFGYRENIFNFGNWYPIACVYDDTGWNLDPYYSIGDPFYSDIANYHIKIKVPREIIVASSGNIVKEEKNKDEKIYYIEGKLIRDFAWVASEDFLVMESYAGDTLVKLYALREDEAAAKIAMDAGVNSLELFNTLFGKYPYGVYSIVMTDFPTGMEYPTIVFINQEYYSENLKEYLEQVIVHETAHQWWYSIVGNDQIDEPWLDEALASYSEVIYMHHIYGEGAAKDYYKYYFQLPYEYMVDKVETDGLILKSLGDFKGWDEYGLLVYTKGTMFINSIKEDFGMDTLYNILKEYYNRYRFYFATTENFIGICEEVTGKSFEERFNKWFYKNKMEGFNPPL